MAKTRGAIAESHVKMWVDHVVEIAVRSEEVLATYRYRGGPEDGLVQVMGTVQA